MGTKNVMNKRKKDAQEENVVKLSEVFEDYMNEKVNNLTQPTIIGYRDSFKRFQAFVGEDATTSVLTSKEIQRWIATMIGDGIKTVSANHYLRAVRTFIIWTSENYPDCVQPFTIKLIPEQEETPKTFDDDEVKLLLERPDRNADFTEWRTYVIVNWILATGNRVSTICSFRVGDLDMKTGYVTLPHTKNKKADRLPISSRLLTVMKEYLRTQRKTVAPKEWLFCDIGEGKLTTNASRQAFRRYCIKRGVTKTSIHGLRHTFAMNWIKNGGDSFRLQKMLGHSTLDMTRKYVRLFGEDIKPDIDRFAPLDNFQRGVSRTVSDKFKKKKD